MTPIRRFRSLHFFIVTALLGCASLSAHAVTAYIRVNLVGYEAGLSARAYLMTTSAVSGVRFVVKNSGGATVASGAVGSKTGAWGSYSVYPIDFTLGKADTYTISVSGAVAATSPEFSVDTPANLYTEALANSLHFYENERDGSDFIATPLRTAAGHLNDGRATVYNTPKFGYDNNNPNCTSPSTGTDTGPCIVGSLSSTGTTINAEGGWWDAGDYLKFVETHSYTVALMLIGVRDFPNQMGSLSTTSNFTNEALFGLQWLQQMWNDSTKTLYYQVGIGTDFISFDYQSDHDIWRLPQEDDTYGGTDSQYEYIRHRPVFVAGGAGAKISPNLAGRLAADFAECFQVFDAVNSKLANQCLFSAEHIFDLADTSPSGNLTTTAPYDFYPETPWRDDLELGATELYFAVQHGNLPAGLPHTDPMFYLQAAANWAHAYITGPDDQNDTLNLYDVSGLAHFELYRAITLAGNPTGLAVSKADLVNDLGNQMIAQIEQAKDPFGFGWPWSDGDSASHGAGISVMANEYYHLIGDGRYAAYSRRWLSNILGANAWGLTFIIGDGSVFPDCPSHQVANLVGSRTGGSPVLAGAVVEGPTSPPLGSGFITNMLACPTDGDPVYGKFNGDGAMYQDNVQVFTTDEPAIDLSTTSFLMFAWRLAGAPTGTP